MEKKEGIAINFQFDYLVTWHNWKSTFFVSSPSFVDAFIRILLCPSVQPFGAWLQQHLLAFWHGFLLLSSSFFFFLILFFFFFFYFILLFDFNFTLILISIISSEFNSEAPEKVKLIRTVIDLWTSESWWLGDIFILRFQVIKTIPPSHPELTLNWNCVEIALTLNWDWFEIELNPIALQS